MHITDTFKKLGQKQYFILGIAMFAYGLKGKYRTRDLMLSKINWTGNERVLDMGTGQGHFNEWSS